MGRRGADYGAERLRKIAPSATVTLSDKARSLRAKGVDVIDLSAGRPHFDTPERIKEAARAALDEGFVFYTQSSGIVELRRAIAEKLEAENGIDVDESEVIVTVGAKQAIFSALLSLLNPGDRVIVTDPCWVSYEAMIRVADAVPVPVALRESEDFRIDLEELEARIDERTRMIMINSPHNPTGAVFPREDLEVIAELAKRHDFYVISDEIYEKVIFDGWRHDSIASFPGMKERTITINGFSKTFSMTGWRLGYAAADKRVIKRMSIIQQHSVTNATSFVQKAGVVALRECRGDVERMVRSYEEMRNFFVGALDKVEGLSCWRPMGTFYAFPRLMGRGEDSVKITEQLLEKERVLVVPGSAFGRLGEGHLRIVFSQPMETLREAAERIRSFFEEGDSGG